MDRRQKKTREAIFAAFSKLLETKRYTAITVQEIIDEADIGRSTFYAHFETKDELLKTMCTDIFRHVFQDEPMSEKTHDFSHQSIGLKAGITHVLYHVKDNKKDIAGILSCESGELFMMYFREYLTEMFSKYLFEIEMEAPEEFVLHHLTGSFAEAVKWWLHGQMSYSPEEVAGYYMAAIPTHHR
ncbi:MAG: TetR/AcrR family transcriptional regulator [Lachnospiraceae bacterium]